MAIYVTATQVIASLPGLNLNSSLDVSETSVNKEIETVARKLRESKKHYFNLSLTDHQLDLLAFINQWLPSARIILRRQAELGPELLKYARAQEDFGKKLLFDWATGKFRLSFQRVTPIPRVTLATIVEACAYTPDFVAYSEVTLDDDDLEIPNPDKSNPSIETISLWLRWCSAMVYSVAANKSALYSVPEDISELTADELEVYNTPTREIVGSQILRVVKAANNKRTIDIEADELLKSGIDNLTALQVGKNRLTFQ